MKNKLAALTIFLGSFLVFGIQPMVGRTLLPVFGGTAAVWVVCLCAFQVFLLGGYWYADWLSRGGRAKKVRGHLALLLAAGGWTIVVALKRGLLLNSLGTASGGNPAMAVLVCVFCLVGVPYMLLGSNASLVQVFAGGDYRLYSVSNAGSLLGLLAYPFLFEPFVSLTAQWLGFAVGIILYAALLWKLTNEKRFSNEDGKNCETSVPQATCLTSRGALWFLLPCVSCFLLDALTTHVTLDVMPMPLMWTASLSLFLLSYIIGFSGQAARLVRPCAVLALVFFLVLCGMNGKPLVQIGLPVALGAYGAFLLFGCTFLHSWLYTVRPDGDRLTKYYLLQSVGGAVGGVVASLAFPMLAKTIAEYPVALFGLAAAAALGLALTAGRLRKVVAVPALAAVGVGAWLYASGAGKETRPVVYRGRGFFEGCGAREEE